MFDMVSEGLVAILCDRVLSIEHVFVRSYRGGVHGYKNVTQKMPPIFYIHLWV